MRWMLCCVWLACCSLDTSSWAAGTSSAEDGPKGEWTPRDTTGGRTSSGASTVKDAATPEQPADAGAVDASSAAAGTNTKPEPADAGGQPRTDEPKPSMIDAAAPAAMSNTPPARDAGTRRPQPSDAGRSSDAAPRDPAPAPDATTADPAPPPDATSDATVEGASDLLVWFALTGNNQQRRALFPLIADLEGTRMIDSNGLLTVLRNFDELQCRRNAAVCYQVCIWATSHCDLCEGWECRRLMFQSCGSDCRTDEAPAVP